MSLKVLKSKEKKQNVKICRQTKLHVYILKEDKQ